MKKISAFLSSFFKKAYEDGLSAYAAQTTFFVMLSFFPFVMLLAMIASKLSIANSNVVEYFASVMPVEFRNYIYELADEIMTANSGSFTVISIVLALWSAAKGIQSLSLGLDRIYEVEKKKNFFINRLISAVYTLVFTLMCLLIVVLHLFGTDIGKRITSAYPKLSDATFLILSLRGAITFIILFLFILLFYYQLPNRKTKLIYEMAGAAIASLTWLFMTYLFALYTRSVSSNMYGSLSSIILSLVWLYMGMQIILYGAEINVFMQEAFLRSKPITVRVDKLLKERK